MSPDPNDPAQTPPDATVEELNGRIFNVHQQLRDLQSYLDEPKYLLRLRVIDELTKLEEARFRALFGRQPGA
jgi:hypothetical protein